MSTRPQRCLSFHLLHRRQPPHCHTKSLLSSTPTQSTAPNTTQSTNPISHRRRQIRSHPNPLCSASKPHPTQPITHDRRRTTTVSTTIPVRPITTHRRPRSRQKSCRSSANLYPIYLSPPNRNPNQPRAMPTNHCPRPISTNTDRCSVPQIPTTNWRPHATPLDIPTTATTTTTA